MDFNSIDDDTVIIEDETSVLSQPCKEWFLVIKDELEIKPLLDKEFWPSRLSDKLNQLRAMAIKNRDRKLRTEQKNNKGKVKSAKKSLNNDDALSVASSRITTSRKSQRVR